MKTLYFLLFLYTSAFGLNTSDKDTEGVLPDKALRVYDGEESSYKQQKHMVNLKIETTCICEGQRVTSTGFCSASIISEKWMVTSAHCFKNNDNVDNIVDLMVYVLRLEHEEWVYLGIAHMNNIIIHPRYVHNLYFPDSRGDIALVETMKPMELSANLVPIRLHQTPLKQTTVATIAGYGKSEYGTLVPRQGPVTVKACSEKVGSKLLCSYNYVRAGSGDSGGPLVSKKGTLLGVTSASCDPGHNERVHCETVFVQVYYYLDWIKKVTGI